MTSAPPQGDSLLLHLIQEPPVTSTALSILVGSQLGMKKRFRA
jgi:hypothetical protein